MSLSIPTSRQESEHELDVGQVATARLGAAEALAGGWVGASYSIGIQHTGRHAREYEKEERKYLQYGCQNDTALGVYHVLGSQCPLHNDLAMVERGMSEVHR